MKDDHLNWLALLSFLGMILELSGVFLMSRKYTNVKKSQIFSVMMSAVVRGKQARDASNIEVLTGAKALSFLQGLSLIGIGFVFQSVAVIVSILN